MAACHSVVVARWERVLAGVLGCFAGRFGRVEPRRAAAGFVTGLLSDLEVKTGWQLAEQAGHARPDAMQRLLYRAVWDADAVRRGSTRPNRPANASSTPARTCRHRAGSTLWHAATARSEVMSTTYRRSRGGRLASTALYQRHLKRRLPY